jgi:hypothetical protein
MKIRLNIDEIKAIVVSYLQASMPSVSEKCVTMDSEGISIETNLSDALGINVETRKRRTRKSAEEVKEEPEESVSTEEPEPEIKEDNTVTGILEGRSDPKGLFD